MVPFAIKFLREYLPKINLDLNVFVYFLNKFRIFITLYKLILYKYIIYK